MGSSKRTLRCGEDIGGVWFFVRVFLNSVDCILDTVNHEFSHNSLTVTPSHYFKKGYDFICQVLIFLKSCFQCGILGCWSQQGPGAPLSLPHVY